MTEKMKPTGPLFGRPVVYVAKLTDAQQREARIMKALFKEAPIEPGEGEDPDYDL